jgi:hypothetical protein
MPNPLFNLKTRDKNIDTAKFIYTNISFESSIIISIHNHVDRMACELSIFNQSFNATANFARINA